MKEKTIRICLPMVLYFLIGLFYLASFVGCTDTKIVAASKIADSDGKVTLSWNNVPGAISYNIYFSRSPKVTQWNSYKIPAASNTIEVTELDLGKTYYFAITVVDQSGESGILTEKSYTVADKAGGLNFGDLAEKRQKAEGQISKEPLTEGQATILWDNVPNAKSYNIYYGESPGVTKQNGIKIANVTSPHTVKGLKPDKVYYFVVTSITNSGESMESPELPIKAGK